MPTASSPRWCIGTGRQLNSKNCGVLDFGSTRHCRLPKPLYRTRSTNAGGVLGHLRHVDDAHDAARPERVRDTPSPSAASARPGSARDCATNAYDNCGPSTNASTMTGLGGGGGCESGTVSFSMRRAHLRFILADRNVDPPPRRPRSSARSDTRARRRTRSHHRPPSTCACGGGNAKFHREPRAPRALLRTVSRCSTGGSERSSIAWNLSTPGRLRKGPLLHRRGVGVQELNARAGRWR